MHHKVKCSGILKPVFLQTRERGLSSYSDAECISKTKAMEPLPEARVTSHRGCSDNVLNVNLSILKPRRVVEVYIKRSLSLREGDAISKKMKWRSLPENVSPRSMNCKEGPGLSDPGKLCRGQDKQQNETESQKHGDKVMPSSNNSLNVESGVEKGASKGRSKDGKKGKKSQTFFGKVFSFLWKMKGDEKKGDGHKRLKDSPLAEHPPEHNGQQYLANNQEPSGELPIIHKKRNSLRRVFSLKRNNSESKDIGLGGPGASKSKDVRPSQLDLKGGCRPRQNKTERDSYYLYEQVSEEAERIVRTLESSEGREDKLKSRRRAEVLETQCMVKSDDSIWKIIEILQNIGDHVDSELQGNSQLCTFFTNISYDAFKELADQYVQKEVKNKGPQENPEFVKLAFTLDFTAKVAGICDHQIKRITGFGSQYLQDTCWQMLSFIEQEETANSAEQPPSPD
ncbi:uncharacterized protein LOC127580942 isoform X2 [Pristis pectinata]|uniref:uncharacterized protein LOC127580942 isoform X2 n=1 Tax=Pristis pectinata TaxID=685728 RepID=UPI00223E5E44|nr:uncharacterized protein LOC127580942 isoform X2 [Pristis pectinata]